MTITVTKALDIEQKAKFVKKKVALNRTNKSLMSRASFSNFFCSFQQLPKYSECM